MTVYLFSDIFDKFKKFFVVDQKDSRFMYDISFGFLPRRFEPNDEDNLIYDEEDEVPEMYFFTEGQIGIGFSLVVNGISKEQKHIVKKLPCPQQICDHYVLNLCKSRFIYVAFQKEVKGFALTKKFVHQQIQPNYNDIFAKLQSESNKTYHKTIFKPVNDEREQKIQMMNKQSVYRNFKLNPKNDKETTNEPGFTSGFAEAAKSASSMIDEEEIKRKIFCEKMVSTNLQDNIDEMQDELKKVKQSIQDMILKCDANLEKVVEKIQLIQPS
jgi:hypothetical protein